MKQLIALTIIFFSFTASSQNWNTKADVPVNLAFPVVVELNGNIHVIGGGAPGGATGLHLRYTPSTNVWDTLADVPFLAQQPAGAVVNGKIHYCGGGYPNTGTRLDKHYIYDSDSAKWFPAANTSFPIAIHKAVSFDNKLYIMSGQPNKTNFQYFHPDSNTWVKKNDLPDGNFWYGAITSTKNGIYRFGGGGFGAPSSAAHFYDQSNDKWNAIPSLPNPLHAASAVAMNDSLIFICGGYYAGVTYDKSYVYNTNNRKYYPSNSLPFGTNYHSIVKVNNCIYSVGGDNSSVSGADVALLELCNPEFKWAVSVPKIKNDKPYAILQGREELMIELKNEITEIKIIDLNGKIILNKALNGLSNQMVINNTDFKKGLYLICLKSEQNSYSEKWINP